MPFPGIFRLVVLLLSVAAIAAAAVPAAASSLDLPSELDPISAGCLSCHDGTGAIHARFCLLSQQGKGCGGHIISASYAELALRSKNLLPESSLPPQLALYEGKITCATCHGSDPHNGEPLALDNHNSTLCRACHLK